MSATPRASCVAGLSMYLIDTNVISEARKGRRANPGVVDFWGHVDAFDLYLCAATVGGLRRGLEPVRRRGDAGQMALLEACFTR